jgi:hypothetical protein
MRRLGLLVGLTAVAVSLMGASAAWGDTITAMCTTSQTTQPCAGGWYTTPILELSWDWTAGGTPSNCNESSYQSDSVATVSCTVSWTDGFTGTQSYTVHVETSSPAATAAPSRLPDVNGWYTAPVSFGFSGSSFSGIASCTSATYAGPNIRSATVAGTCTDNAGKTVAVTSAPFAYDVTAPTLTAAADPGDQNVALSWQAGGDVAAIASIQVTRSGGTKAAGADTVYTGSGTGFTDKHLKNGVRYTYTITARDLAGNASVTTISTTPAARLLGPALNAHLTTPPMLSWTAAPSATYYNVQLFRGTGRKVLSLWPAQASVQLRQTWRFEGHRYRLKPGKYRWYVWPGVGRRKAGRYGHMIGSGTFVVMR